MSQGSDDAPLHSFQNVARGRTLFCTLLGTVIFSSFSCVWVEQGWEEQTAEVLKALEDSGRAAVKSAIVTLELADACSVRTKLVLETSCDSKWSKNVQIFRKQN